MEKVKPFSYETTTWNIHMVIFLSSIIILCAIVIRRITLPSTKANLHFTRASKPERRTNRGK